jgi:hypothetical protein
VVRFAIERAAWVAGDPSCVVAVFAVWFALVFAVARSEAQNVTGQLPPLRSVVTDPATLASPGNQGLSLNLTAFESYDDNDVLPGSQATSVPLPVYHRTGARTGGNAMLNYDWSHSGQRLSFGAHGVGGAHAYSTSKRVFSQAGGGFFISAPLGQRMQVSATTMARYAPYYNFGLFQGINGFGQGGAINGLDPDIDFAVAPSSSLNYSATTRLSYQLTRLTSAELHYETHGTAFSGGLGNFQSRYVGGRIRHELTRGLGAHFGYSYGRGTHGGIQGPELHNIDVGVDYSRGLAFTKGRTTVAFSVGSALAAGSYATSPRFVLDREHFRVTGTARVNREIGRTWSAHVMYRRGFEFVDIYNDVFFMDTVTTGLGGSIGRRMAAGVTGSYLHGAVGFAAGNRHEAFRGQASITYGLTSWASLYGQYSQYHFQLPTAVVLPSGFPSSLDRRSVRGGVTVRMQLLPRAR